MTEINQINLAILFSGNGSNMQNLIESLHNETFIDSAKNKQKITIALTLCNNKDAYGIKRLSAFADIPCVIIEHKAFADRLSFDKEMIKHIKKYKIDLCVLAGFMRILTPYFINNTKAINIHPSLLPAHKGANAIKDTFNSNDKQGGVSIHWVSNELDSGEIIMQQAISIESSDTLQSFESKIHALEYELYPNAVLKALNLTTL